jgi:hypothetical protein
MPRSLLLPCLVALGGCGMSSTFNATPRPVEATPAAFAVDTTFHRTTTTVPAGACLTHLVDPRDGTTLVLDRAQAGIGDFIVTPADRYGLRPDERLRVACATGTPLGAVPK